MNGENTETTHNAVQGKECPGCGRIAESLEWANAANIGTLYCSRKCAIRSYWTTDIHVSLREINARITYGNQHRV
jgi:hypothetical protein